MRLSPRDYDALQRTILELYAYRDLRAFRQAVPGIFLRIIPADYFGLTDLRIDAGARRIEMVDYCGSQPRLTPDFVARLERAAPDHPFTKYSITTLDPTALKFTDFMSHREYEESALYRECYSYADIGRLLAVASFGEEVTSTLNLTRRINERDFTERDRLILNLLRPHFTQARRNAELDSARRERGAKSYEELGFTRREAEVARWLGWGKTNPEIAVILRMSPRTVEKHMERILEKLGVENRTAAAVIVKDAPQ